MCRLERIVRDLLKRIGQNFENPAANTSDRARHNENWAEKHRAGLMGMRIQCANATITRSTVWTGMTTTELRGIFFPDGSKTGDDPRETVIFDAAAVEVKHTVKGAAMGVRISRRRHAGNQKKQHGAG